MQLKTANLSNVATATRRPYMHQTASLCLSSSRSLSRALVDQNLVAAGGEDEEKKRKSTRRHVVDAVLVPCKPPEGLFTNLCVCPIDASVVVRVAVVSAILVSTFVFFPVKSVYKYDLTHSVPKRFRTVVHILA